VGAEGVFMTQLFAEEKRRCEYAIELCDPTGTRVPTSPDRVVYTLGIVPDKPPASHTIGVGLANDDVRCFLEKGTKLPARKMCGLHSTVPLRAGNAEDVLRIAVIEGENARATRNHGIGVLLIPGTKVRRDLPIGSEIEVTILMDESQRVRVQAFVPVLDEDFEIAFDLNMLHNSLEKSREEMKKQKDRLAKAREKAQRTKAMKADAALSRIEKEHLIDEVDALMDAAGQDPDAMHQLDRRVRDFTAAVDNVEDAAEWPALLERAEASRRDADRLVNELGDASEKNRLRTLENDLQRAIDAGDPDMLRQCADELDGLWFQVADRQAAFHVGRFNHLVQRLGSMRDPAQAEQLIAQGRRAINNNDVQALKAANRQLMSLLPRDVQVQEDERRSHLI
jgi:molecular chaperone DnaK